MGNTIGKMKELIQELNTASYAYYTSTPIMSDYDWDKKYEELQMLESQENEKKCRQTDRSASEGRIKDAW